MSSLTLSNNTPCIAMFTALKGGLVIARIPGIAPGAQLRWLAYHLRRRARA